jgi:hypothetical protein
MSEIGPLDLSDADTSGIKPVEAGTYAAEVFATEWRKTKGGPNAKMPEGTPMLSVQVKLTANAQGDTQGIANRRAFTQFTIPPAGYDAGKAATMKGILATFLMAAGYPEDTVKSKKFNLEAAKEELVGREIGVVLGIEKKYGTEDEYQNVIKGFKHISKVGTADSASPALL